jgi:hypothetical protein
MGYHFGVATDTEAWMFKLNEDDCMSKWFTQAMAYYQAGHGHRFPSVLSASSLTPTSSHGEKDAVAEAVMYATYRQGVPTLNVAGNFALNACLNVPSNMSPYIISVGGLSPSVMPLVKEVPAYVAPGSQGEATQSPWFYAAAQGSWEQCCKQWNGSDR